MYSIKARLRQEGWADELNRMANSGSMHELKHHKAVRKPQKLTDAGSSLFRSKHTGETSDTNGTGSLAVNSTGCHSPDGKRAGSTP